MNQLFDLRLLALITATFSLTSIAPAASLLVVGNTNYGLTLPPAGDNFVAIAAGRDHNLALSANGKVFGWGDNANGRATAPTNLSSVVAISAGSYHSLALKADGTVAGFGYSGEKLSMVPLGLENVAAIAAGGFHNLALKADGTVSAWGFKGQRRVQIPGRLKRVIAIAAGRDHSLALRSDGTVAAWGVNKYKQSSVPPGLSNAVAVAAGDYHSLALRSDGTVVAWGSNERGQSLVPAGLNNVVAIAAGHLHSVALTREGKVVGWGDNSKGQITFNPAMNNVAGISAGAYHTTLLIGSRGRIVDQPVSQTVLPGSEVSFEVSTVGTGALTYRWNLNGQPITDGLHYSGSQSSELAVKDIGQVLSGRYDVDVFSGGEFIGRANALLLVRQLGKVRDPVFLPNGKVRLRFGDFDGALLNSTDRGRYQIEVSNNLKDWEPVGATPELVNGELQLDDAPGEGDRFYRVIER